MPLLESDERDVKHRLVRMYMDTIETFRLISVNTDLYFGENALELSAAIDEYVYDFIDNTDGEERIHPEGLIFNTDRLELQSAGFYGAQLSLKERQVTRANSNLRTAIGERTKSAFRKPFNKWIDVINNFTGSLEVTGIGSAIKEIKDCLRDELPDSD